MARKKSIAIINTDDNNKGTTHMSFKKLSPIQPLIIFMILFFFSAIHATPLNQNIQPHIVGIITPMPSEEQPFNHLISNEIQIKKNGMTYWTGNIGNTTVVLTLAGIGKVNAASATTSLIRDFHPSVIFLSGIAGGINLKNQSLHVGDIVIANHVYAMEHEAIPKKPNDDEINSITHQITPITIPTNAKFLSLLQRYVNHHHAHTYKMIFGNIATTDIFPAPNSQIIQLQQQRFSAIDMESFAVAQVGWLYHTPVVIIRGISDLPLVQQHPSSTYSIQHSAKFIAETNAARFLAEFIQSNGSGLN